jgi:PqqD family protein of HPr-rel-A system
MSTLPAVLPERGSRLLTAVLDGEEVVYDPIRREAHLLNPTASLLLSRCDGQTAIGALLDELEDAFGADRATLEADLGVALADFRARRLVGPDPSAAEVPSVPRPQPELAPTTEPLVVPGRWAVESPIVHALGSRVRVRSDEPLVGRYVDQVLRPLLGPEDDRPVHTFDVVVGGPGPIRLLLDGTEVGATTTLDAAMSYLQWNLNQLAIDEAEGAVLLHASAVRSGPRIAVFPAASNSGKSTLAAGLVRAGLGYLTDEAVAVGLDTGAVTAYPKPLSLDPGSWSLFPGLEPRVEGTAETFFSNEWHLDARALHPGAVEPAPDARIALVAFPTYVPGARTAFEPVGRAEGLLLLLQNSFNMASALGPGLAALTAIAADATVVRLTVGDLDEAVEMIRTTLSQNHGSAAALH